MSYARQRLVGKPWGTLIACASSIAVARGRLARWCSSAYAAWCRPPSSPRPSVVRMARWLRNSSPARSNGFMACPAERRNPRAPDSTSSSTISARGNFLAAGRGPDPDSRQQRPLPPLLWRMLLHLVDRRHQPVVCRGLRLAVVGPRQGNGQCSHPPLQRVNRASFPGWN